REQAVGLDRRSGGQPVVDSRGCARMADRAGAGRAGRRRSEVTRTAADIGAGLLPPRAPRRIRAGERIHVVGVAGAGASAAALLAHAAGAAVSGCDAGGPSPYSVAVEAAGIPVAWAHDPAHVRLNPPPG